MSLEAVPSRWSFLVPSTAKGPLPVDGDFYFRSRFYSLQDFLLVWLYPGPWR
jgi:hypothetical protein